MTDRQIPPMMFDWDGEVMRPTNAKRADEHYYVGGSYRLAPYEERSPRSHGHYFASLSEGWKNLGQEDVDRWPSVEHFRKWALIEGGWCDTETHVFSYRKDALVCAALVRRRDAFAIVTVADLVLTVYTAHSQDMRSMSGKVFQASKESVLNKLAERLGVTTRELERNREI